MAARGVEPEDGGDPEVGLILSGESSASGVPFHPPERVAVGASEAEAARRRLDPRGQRLLVGGGDRHVVDDHRVEVEEPGGVRGRRDVDRPGRPGKGRRSSASTRVLSTAGRSSPFAWLFSSHASLAFEIDAEADPGPAA
jgi:hypothetical protein